MSDFNKSFPSIERIKQRAKKLRKELGITHSEALNKISTELGFPNWQALQRELGKAGEKSAVYKVKVGLDSPQIKIIANKKLLTQLGVEFSTFEITETGLKKSIIDATQSVRAHFELEGFHVYSDQIQGPENKIVKKATLVSNEQLTNSKVSLYRPKTKQGDPRMWFRELPSFASSEDEIGIIIHNDSAYLINFNIVSIKESLEQLGSKVGEFIRQYRDARDSIANELLLKLKVLAKEPFPTQRKGDTGIGYTLETMLGIVANSSKKPDYKGIEIKSGRAAKTRTTLFAQVADWSISPCKKSAEILDKYGYARDEDFKLYCTVSTLRENPQGLSFRYEENKDDLQEWYKKSDLVAVWPGKLLRKRLREKHAETFWVEATTEIIDGLEYFQLVKVTHTKSPVTSQLLPLIQAGTITMDHLIKRSGETNRVSEKGPLFKINKRDLNQLFPLPVNYSLN